MKQNMKISLKWVLVFLFYAAAVFVLFMVSPWSNFYIDGLGYFLPLFGLAPVLFMAFMKTDEAKTANLVFSGAAAVLFLAGIGLIAYKIVYLYLFSDSNSLICIPYSPFEYWEGEIILYWTVMTVQAAVAFFTGLQKRKRGRG